MVPGQEADPRLHVIVQLEDDVVRFGDLAGWVGDLVFWFLVLDDEFSTNSMLILEWHGRNKGQKDIPARIDRLARGAFLELFHGGGTDVGEVVRARGGDYLVPDHGLVLGNVTAGDGGRGVRPLGRHVDEDLLGVPGEEGREVRLEGELNHGIFFFFGAVVVWSAADSVIGWREIG